MNEHITPEQAARWVAGLCEDDESAGLERHIAGCAPCTTLVQREAVAEQVMAQAVATLPVQHVVALRPRGRRVVLGLVVAAALAASLIALFRPAPAPVVEPMSFVVIDAGDELELVMGVPRYEDAVAQPMLAATAYEPFPL